MSKFITNKNKLLKEVIESILPTSDNLRFLVGYFYFSGFHELVDGLKDKKIKVLIGMEIERQVLGKVRQYLELEDRQTISRQTQRENFYHNFVAFFNDTDFFDSKEKIKAFKIYLKKIKDGSLQIKKTRDPNHAKLYLFEKLPEYSEGKEYPGVLITGSSNLTYHGLLGRSEINVQLREKTSYKEAKKLFDKLWDSAIVLADKEHTKEFEKKVLQNIWYQKKPSPYLMYLRVLEEYFSFTDVSSLRLPSEMTKGKYLNLKYQIDAIKEGRQALRKHNGVIIADVVGLGKSIIASAIAHDTILETIIICPPHLKPQWKDYKYDFNLQAKIYSTHYTKIEKALREHRFRKNNFQKLIIVDEAHRFKNEESLGYQALHELCQDNKVVLLTATPFNNEPQDIFAMIKLFQVPAKSTLQTVDNLSYRFQELAKKYKKVTREQREKTISQKELKEKIDNIAHRIRLMIESVVIRRSRIDLEKNKKWKEDLENMEINLQRPEPPELLEYDLGKISPIYSRTLTRIVPEADKKQGYKASRYMPLAYVKDEFKERVQEEFGGERIDVVAQENVAGFMKRLLVRRFESSMPAFQITLENLISSAENVKRWYEYHHKIPIFKKGEVPDLSEDIINSWDEQELTQYFDSINPEEKYAKEVSKGMHLIKTKYMKKTFNKDLEADLTLLRSIRDTWQGEIESDPKLDYFKKNLKEKLEENPQRKIVVFSEFADTIEYLYQELTGGFKVMKYTGGQPTKTKKKQLRRNFDAGIPENEQSDKFDILLATDSISEGYSLHRAGVIYNYDIPYNPTRVIQRIGRLNRVDKKTFAHIYVYNFFPSAIGEKETRTKAISTLKMQMIHTLLGEDVQALTPDEEAKSVFYRQYKEVIDQEEQESWDTAYRQESENIKQVDKEAFEQAMAIPRRSKILRSKKFDKDGVVIFAEKGEEYKFMLAYGPDEKDQEILTPEEALQIFKAKKSEKSKNPSSSFDHIYQSMKKNLFTRKTDVPKSRSVAEAITQIEYLIDNSRSGQDYLEDLLTVARDLDGLSNGHIKQIKNIKVDDPGQAISELKKIARPSYLQSIIRASQKVEEGDEKLILTQEISKK